MVRANPYSLGVTDPPRIVVHTFSSERDLAISLVAATATAAIVVATAAAAIVVATAAAAIIIIAAAAATAADRKPKQPQPNPKPQGGTAAAASTASETTAATATAAAAAAAPAAAAAAPASGQLQAGPTRCGVLLIEDVEGRQTDVGDFFVAEHELVARVAAARRQVDRVTDRLGG
jgi:hypothetical protein